MFENKAQAEANKDKNKKKRKNKPESATEDQSQLDTSAEEEISSKAEVLEETDSTSGDVEQLSQAADTVKNKVPAKPKSNITGRKSKRR